MKRNKEKREDNENFEETETEEIVKKEKKEKPGFKLGIKTFFIFLAIVLGYEFMFSLLMFDTYVRESVINVLLHSIMVAAVLSIVTQLFSKKVGKRLSGFLVFMISFIVGFQIVFFNIFTTFFDLSFFSLADQTAKFGGTAVRLISQNILFVILCLGPSITYLVASKKFSYPRNRKVYCSTYLVILVAAMIAFTVHANSTKGKVNGTYYLYNDVNATNLNIQKLGVLNTFELDGFRGIFGFEEKMQVVEEDPNEKKEETIIKYDPNTLELNLDKDTSNETIKKINAYINTCDYTDKNDYTGIFKGYNLVYITAESFSEIGVSEELTPTLYKLINTGFVFDNYYTPTVLSTIGGEFQSLTGLYPNGSILNTWRSGRNYFPHGLGNVFNGLGYNVNAYHNNSYKFQDRHQYLASQGFTRYIGQGNGMEKRMNCKTWPQSDVEMIDGTVADYVDGEEPFLAYYMTVSGHMGYSWGGNAMARKNRDLVKDLDVSEEAKAYVATQIELDRALEHLIAKLEEKGKLDKTVIVLLADHYPYGLSHGAINELSDHERDLNVGACENALILWNNKINDKHITKPCMSCDVLPTVYNLFGVDYDSRLYCGRDILSSSEGLVIFNNRSWITDKGSYNSQTGKFTPTENVDENYSSRINSIVNNRLNMSKYIIETNYYNYLFH